MDNLPWMNFEVKFEESSGMSNIILTKAHSITIEEFEKMTVDSSIPQNVQDSDIEILEQVEKKDKLCEIIEINESVSNDFISENFQENFKNEILEQEKKDQENILGISKIEEAFEKVYNKANIQRGVTGNFFFLKNNDFNRKYSLFLQLFRLLP